MHRIVHASAFALSREPCRSAVRKAFTVARAMGKIISLDPNYSPLIWPNQEEARHVIEELYALTDITKPSLDDARRFFGDDHFPHEYIARFHDLGPRIVILTMGSGGILISKDRELLGHVPARPIEITDATGAGDSFWAGFLVALLDGNSLERSVLFGREIVERKLQTVGPLLYDFDKSEIYAGLPDPTEALKPWDASVAAIG